MLFFFFFKTNLGHQVVFWIRLKDNPHNRGQAASVPLNSLAHLPELTEVLMRFQCRQWILTSRVSTFPSARSGSLTSWPPSSLICTTPPNSVITFRETCLFLSLKPTLLDWRWNTRYIQWNWRTRSLLFWVQSGPGSPPPVLWWPYQMYICFRHCWKSVVGVQFLVVHFCLLLINWTLQRATLTRCQISVSRRQWCFCWRAGYRQEEPNLLRRGDATQGETDMSSREPPEVKRLLFSSSLLTDPLHRTVDLLCGTQI